jgi:hypothetical protein
MMNIEQGMSNVEGKVRTHTSAFDIPCSIFIILFSCQFTYREPNIELPTRTSVLPSCTARS